MTITSIFFADVWIVKFYSKIVSAAKKTKIKLWRHNFHLAVEPSSVSEEITCYKTLFRQFLFIRHYFKLELFVP